MSVYKLSRAMLTMMRGDLAIARNGPTKPLSFLERGPSDAFPRRVPGPRIRSLARKRSLGGPCVGEATGLRTRWLKLQPAAVARRWGLAFGCSAFFAAPADRERADWVKCIECGAAAHETLRSCDNSKYSSCNCVISLRVYRYSELPLSR